MSLNIKSERAVALVRTLAARTGMSQTSAVEDAVARRIAELDRADSDRAGRRRSAADAVLSELGRMLTDDDRAAIRYAESDLYDDLGLPR